MLILKKYIFRIVSMKNFEKDFDIQKWKQSVENSVKDLFREDFRVYRKRRAIICHLLIQK